MSSICIHLYHTKERYFKKWSTDTYTFFEMTWYRSRPLWRVVLGFKFYVYTTILGTYTAPIKSHFWICLYVYIFIIRRAVLQKLKYRYIYSFDMSICIHLYHTTERYLERTHNVSVAYICIHVWHAKRRYFKKWSTEKKDTWIYQLGNKL